MRFVTDLDKGILGKPDSNIMWTNIVSCIPDSVLLKPNVKVLCVAYGHGTEAVIIAKRMLALGRTKEEVRNSIYMIDKYIVFRMPMELKGFTNIITADFLEWETDMKFDVVVGNPPYQSGNQGLWQSFAKKAIDILNHGGTLSFVTPNSWSNGSHTGTEKNIFNSIFQKYNCVEIYTDVNKEFKDNGQNIGKNISAWTVVKEDYKGSTRVIDKDGNSKNIDISKYPFFINEFSFEALEVFEKVLKHGVFYSEFVEKAPYSDKYFAFPKAQRMKYDSFGYRYNDIEENFPTSKVTVGIDCSAKTLDQVMSIHSQFNSSVFRFLWKIYGANDAGSFGWILRSMPRLPDDKVYSNQDVYKVLGLEDYAEFIEEYVN